MHFHMEFGGGLGDVLMQLHHNGTYNLLDSLGPNDTADVWLVCHNPHAHELFTTHPNRDRIKVHNLGYWSPAEDAAMRRRHGMPAIGMNRKLPVMQEGITFYPTAEDEHILATLPPRYLLLAAGAGMPDRCIPSDQLVRYGFDMWVRRRDLPLVAVGRDYERQGRSEPTVNGVAVNLVNQLTVPGTMAALLQAEGVVTAHSALCLMAWHYRKPTWLIIPREILKAHSKHGVRDPWLVGLDYPGNQYTLLEEFEPRAALTFLENFHA